MNVVYYDEVIWQANYTVKNRTIQNDMNYAVYPVASITKVFTVSASRLYWFFIKYSQDN